MNVKLTGKMNEVQYWAKILINHATADALRISVSKARKIRSFKNTEQLYQKDVTILQRYEDD